MSEVLVNTSPSFARGAQHRAPWCCLIVCSLVVHLGADQQITVSTEEREVAVGFQLPDSPGDDLVPALATCAKINVRYSVELRRIVLGWIDRAIATALVQNTAECVDAATPTYRLERRLNNNIVAQSPAADQRYAVRFLTEFDPLPLFNAWMVKEPGTYGIRVRAVVDRGFTIPPIRTGSLLQTTFSVTR
jgi:hypothetical protein